MTADEYGQPVDLPGGAPLAPGETALVWDRFMVNTVAGYLHTELMLTNRRLYALKPTLLFGLIKVGTSRANYPIENIAGVSAATRFDVLGVIFGALALVVGIGVLAIPGVALLGWLLILLGAGCIIGAPKQAIEVMNSGGGTIQFRVSVFDRGRTVEFANRVSEAVARIETPARQHAASGSPRGETAPPSDRLRHLLDLRDQGLISDAEYAAKRPEVLARL